jgi:hypothetical protein
MSTHTSTTVQFDEGSGFEIRGFEASGAVKKPFVTIKACDDGDDLIIILRDHVAIDRLRMALNDADHRLTTLNTAEAVGDMVAS